MATDFTQESVLRFLLRNGGNVRNADLLTHFKEFLREHEDRARNRELFKRYVNTVATVKQEDGVSYIVLRKKYHSHLGDVASSAAPSVSRADKKQDGVGQSNVEARAAKTNQTGDPSVKTQRSRVQNTEQFLPVAGIVNNSGNHTDKIYLDKTFQISSHQPWEQRVSSVPSKERDINTCTLGMSSFSLDSKRSSGSGQSFDQTPEVREITEKTNLQHNEAQGAKPGQLREASICTQKCFHPPPDYSHPELRVNPLSRDSAHKHTVSSSFQSFDENPSCDWPFPVPSRQSQISASSPCLTEIPTDASFLDAYRHEDVSLSNDDLLRPDRYGQDVNIYIQEPEIYSMTTKAPASPAARRHNLPLDTPHSHVASGYLEPRCLQGLSSSQNSLHLPSSINSNWSREYKQDIWSSDDAVNYRGVVLVEDGEKTHANNSHSHEVEILNQEYQLTPWHHSTGHLLDEKTQASLPSSAPNEFIRNRPSARRLSHRLRSRMCRSLGADLDRAFKEDGDTARIKRLHRITSFLNVSSSQAHSSLNSVSPASSVQSLNHDYSSYGHRNTQVPLEPHEHEWFVKAAAGIWTDIYSLFREDPSLLAKRDFVSGYTVLHWIAKHGDHRVLNTLSYGVHKAGMTLDVDARSTCGYTPLHLAAIHGHKNLLRLLVHKFKANASLRDNNGKRPWQYLEQNNDRDLFDLLGAPEGKTRGSAWVQWSLDRPPVPPVIRSAPTVKRHTSLAALFKHKSQLRVSASAESL